jgi:hypothetical protein
MKRSLLPVLLLAAACGSGNGNGNGADASLPVEAILEIPRGGSTSEYYALPFPNDLRLKDDGSVDLDDYPRPNPILQEYFDIFGPKTKGFGTNSAGFFRFTGEIDPATLPATPADSIGETASVYLVDIDPDSPGHGSRIPLRFRFQSYEGVTIGPNWLSCLPYPGFPLRPLTTYAFVVTNRVKAPGGAVVGRTDFAALVAETGSDAERMHAKTLYAPLLTWLEEAVVDDVDDVINAAVFTTQDPTSMMGKIRQVVQALPTPAHTGPEKLSTNSAYTLWEGTYQGPNFQTGLPPYATPEDGGEIVVDEEGMPIVQRTETLRFALTIPTGDMPENGWPIVIYSHGTGGDYRSFTRDGTAARLAAENLAVLGVDQVLHGPRIPEGASIELSFFNLDNPLSARDNVRQGAADNFQIMRLIPELAAVDGGTTHTFNATKIYFFGHSQGGLTGPPFLAAEPDVKGAVLSGAGGLIYYSLLNKTKPVNIPGLIALIVRDFPLDEFNPVLAMTQMYLEPSDPVNYAPLFIREPPSGMAPKPIFQSEGLIDNFTPPPNIEALGVAIGLTPVPPIIQVVPGFGLREIESDGPPLSNNLNGVTGVFLQYTAVDDDGHFVVFDIPAARLQSAKFLGTLAYTGTALLVAP